MGLNTVIPLLLHKVNKIIKMEVKPSDVLNPKPFFLLQSYQQPGVKKGTGGQDLGRGLQRQYTDCIYTHKFFSPQTNDEIQYLLRESNIFKA